jgi:hypothetical protein
MLIDFEKQNINPEFEVHKLNEIGFKRVNLIKDIFNESLNKILGICPPSRELSIVRTKLEEACFYAKKSMANDVSNQISKE